MNSAELKQGLAQFTGTDDYHQHLFGNMKFTDGVKFFAENAGGGAYWYLDIIATEVMQLQQSESFIHVALDASEIENSAILRADDGNGNQFWSRNIEFTDCPPGTWEFYLIDGILLLTGEY